MQLAENEIRLLCLTAKEIFMSQPNLLELEAPIKICGGFFRSFSIIVEPEQHCVGAGGSANKGSVCR